MKCQFYTEYYFGELYHIYLSIIIFVKYYTKDYFRGLDLSRTADHVLMLSFNLRKRKKINCKLALYSLLYLNKERNDDNVIANWVSYGSISTETDLIMAETWNLSDLLRSQT